MARSEDIAFIDKENIEAQAALARISKNQARSRNYPLRRRIGVLLATTALSLGVVEVADNMKSNEQADPVTSIERVETEDGEEYYTDQTGQIRFKIITVGENDTIEGYVGRDYSRRVMEDNGIEDSREILPGAPVFVREEFLSPDEE